MKKYKEKKLERGMRIEFRDHYVLLGRGIIKGKKKLLEKQWTTSLSHCRSQGKKN